MELFDDIHRDKDHVVLLSAQGTGNLKEWKQSSVRATQKVFDHSIKTYAFQLSGIPSTAVRISYPYDGKTSLNLEHGYLIMQIKVSETRDFSFETMLCDVGGTKRKLQFSTFYKEIQIGPQAAKIPLQSLLRDQWCNVTVPIEELLAEFWPGQYFKCLDSLVLCANSLVRRVFVMKRNPGEMSSDGKDVGIPDSCRLERGSCPSQILDSQTLGSKTRKSIQLPASVAALSKTRTHLLKGRPPMSNTPASHPEKPAMGRRSASSAPSQVRNFRRGVGSPGLTAKAIRSSSASLPKIDKVQECSEPQASSSLLNISTLVLPDSLKPIEASTATPDRIEKSVMEARRQAWRGESAYGGRKPLGMTKPKLPEPRPSYSLSDHEEEREEGIASPGVMMTLHERIAAALRGPDEKCNCTYEDSDEDSPPLGLSSRSALKPHSYLKPTYPSTSKSKPQAPSKPSPRFKPVQPLNYGLDEDELQVLASMKRSALEASRKAASSFEEEGREDSSGLKRHEYEDEDEDWNYDYEAEERVSGMASRNQSRNEMALSALDSSLSQSLLSSRLREAKKHNGLEELGIEKEDSGMEDSEETGCPTLDLIFDPELNVFFHPVTKQFFQVSS